MRNKTKLKQYKQAKDWLIKNQDNHILVGISGHKKYKPVGIITFRNGYNLNPFADIECNTQPLSKLNIFSKENDIRDYNVTLWFNSRFKVIIDDKRLEIVSKHSDIIFVIVTKQSH
jgi:hypothetical protein